MGKRYRQDDVDAWHHVMNRGIARRPTFENRADVRYFLSRVAHAVRREDIEVHAYCVMTTHFHMLVRSPHGRLSDGMRRLQNEYVRYFNRRSRRDGPLFRGRFNSRPVITLEYRQLLVKYIDDNAVSAGVARTAALYAHGSAQHYKRTSGPPWLERSWIESVVMASMSRSDYWPGGYEAAWGAALSPGLARIVEQRIACCGPEPDPMDEFTHLRTPAVESWMRYKAKLADGTKPGLSVCDAQSIREVIAEQRSEHGAWEVKPTRQRADGWNHCYVSLLRDLAALSWPEVGHIVGCSEGGALKTYKRHQVLMTNDPDYARRTAELGTLALAACRGDS